MKETESLTLKATDGYLRHLSILDGKDLNLFKLGDRLNVNSNSVEFLSKPTDFEYKIHEFYWF